jgi:hypothetical protein
MSEDYVRFGIVEEEDGWVVVDLVFQKAVSAHRLSREAALDDAMRQAAMSHTRPFVSVEEFIIRRNG